MSREVENAIINLLMGDGNSPGQRFYGNFLSSVNRVYTKSIPTAAVSVTDQINLYINRDFFKSLTLEQRKEVLIHEALHCFHLHMQRADVVGVQDKKLWNIACDAAINGPLTSLHEMGVTPAKLREAIPDVVDGETAEYYYKKLRDYKNENQKMVQDIIDQIGDTLDDHDKWDEKPSGEGEEEESAGSGQLENWIQAELVKQAIQKAADRAGGRSMLPQEIQEILRRMNQSTVNWKQQLRRFFARADHATTKPTRKKLNRRYRHLQPGRRKDPLTHIAVALDESGSVGNDEFTQFFAEIDRIVETGTKVTVIHADCEINKVYEYEPKMEIKRTGRGGTAYMPAIKKAKELKVDGLIYFGDGDIFGEELFKPQFPVLWALVRNSPPPAEWGGVCRVEVRER